MSASGDAHGRLSVRGFYGGCNSNLFWQPVRKDATGIVAGNLDQPIHLMSQIFTGEKADFVVLTDGVPIFMGPSDGTLEGDFV